MDLELRVHRIRRIPDWRPHAGIVGCFGGVLARTQRITRVIVGPHHPNRDLGQPSFESFVTANETKGFNMGFRRRVRRRALVAGAVAGGAMVHHERKKADEEAQAYDQAPAEEQAPAQEQPAYAPPAADPADEIEHLAQLHSSGALTDEEFAAAKAKILGT
jgi:hypothetical protein